MRPGLFLALLASLWVVAAAQDSALVVLVDGQSDAAAVCTMTDQRIGSTYDACGLLADCICQRIPAGLGSAVHLLEVAGNGTSVPITVHYPNSTFVVDLPVQAWTAIELRIEAGDYMGPNNGGMQLLAGRGQVQAVSFIGLGGMVYVGGASDPFFTAACNVTIENFDFSSYRHAGSIIKVGVGSGFLTNVTMSDVTGEEAMVQVQGASSTLMLRNITIVDVEVPAAIRFEGISVQIDGLYAETTGSVLWSAAAQHAVSHVSLLSPAEKLDRVASGTLFTIYAIGESMTILSDWQVSGVTMSSVLQVEGGPDGGPLGTFHSSNMHFDGCDAYGTMMSLTRVNGTLDNVTSSDSKGNIAFGLYLSTLTIAGLDASNAVFSSYVLVSSSDVRFAGCVINGGSSTWIAGQQESSFASSYSFDSVTFTNVTGMPMSIANGDITVTNSSFTNCTDSIIVGTADDTTFSMADCSFSGNADIPLYLLGTIVLQRSTFDGGHRPTMIMIEPGSSPTSTALVEDCSFHNTGIAISVVSATISYCNFTNPFSTDDVTGYEVNSILLHDASSSALIEGCIFHSANEFHIQTDSSFESLPSALSVIADSRTDVHVRSCAFVKCLGYSGGAIIGRNTLLTVSNSTFSECTALSGGAISLDGGTLTLEDAQLEHCVSHANGGAVWLSVLSNLHVTRTLFSFCSADSMGGAIFQTSNAASAVTSCSFFNCTAQSGGAISLVDRASSTIEDVIFSGNSALSSGGAVFCKDESSPLLIQCVLSGNTANGNGGGMFIGGTSSAMIYTSELFRNEANVSGGGLYVQDNATPMFSELNFSKNEAGVAGGGAMFAMNSSPVLLGSHFYRNSAKTGAGGIGIVDKATPFIDGCTVQGNFASSGGGVEALASTNTTLRNVLFLENDSQAFAGGLLVGDSASVMLLGCNFTANTASAQDSGGGAVAVIQVSEINASGCVFIENSAKRHGGGIYHSSVGNSSISDSLFHLNRAGEAGGAFHGATLGTVSVAGCLIRENHSSRNGGGLSLAGLRSLTVVDSIFADNYSESSGGGLSASGRMDLLVNNCSFTRNHAVGRGGGMAMADVRYAAVDRLTFRENSADGDGGGFWLSGCSGQLTRMQFQGNLAANGGGLTWAAPVSVCPGRFLEDLLFEDNYSVSNGGGMSVANTAPQVTGNGFISVIANLTFSNNHAGGSGGGISLSPPEDVTIQLEEVIFQSNSAHQLGGAVYSSQSDGRNVISEGTFIDNTAAWGGCNFGFRVVHNADAVLQNSCSECTLSLPSNSTGYNSAEGFASYPLSMAYANSSNCPASMPLDAPQFDLAISILDAFANVVRGELLVEELYVIQMADAGANCTLLAMSEPKSLMQQPVSAASGQAVFQNVSLAGQDGGTCRLAFTTKPTRASSGSLAMSRSDIRCTIPLSGCGDGEQVVQGSPYDSCEAVVETGNMIALVMVCLISCLMLLVCLLLLSNVMMRYRERKKREEEEYYARLEIDDLMLSPGALTIFDILNDPEISQIPWDELEVGAKVGEGASGVVTAAIWRPEHAEEQDVALKVLAVRSEELSKDTVDKFLAEIKLSSALRHPNVVRFLGVSYNDDRLYLVTELMGYGNLATVLQKKGGNMSFALKMKLVIDTAKGMRFLHRKKIIHRDLKPQNVLVSNQWVCKVADFGASRLAAGTATMTVVGTPIYMAPEVLNNERYSDTADVYSFGILLVQVFTGRRPYSEYDMNDAQLMFKIYHEHLRPDTSALPVLLRQLVDEAVHPQPTLRPTFEELLLRLSRLRLVEDDQPGDARNVRSRPNSQAVLSAADLTSSGTPDQFLTKSINP